MNRREFAKKVTLGTISATILPKSFHLYDSISAQKDKKGNREVLYNGIELPESWPPQTMDPRSTEPMRVPYLENPPEIIPINVGRQLFIDDFLIESTNLKRVYHAAKKYEGNPVFGPDTKYELEGRTGLPQSEQTVQTAVTYLGHGGVFFDPEEELFKMFYTAGWRGGLAMATSKDLINWKRPDLGVIGNSNLLLPGGQLFAGDDNSIWLDINAEDADERLKYLVHRRGNYSSEGNHTLHTSADGKVWSQGLFTTKKFADYSSFFYNPFRDVWAFSIKVNTERGRARSYFESKTFLEGVDWEKAVFWTDADRLDQPDPDVGDTPQLYSLNAVAYESIILGEFYIHLGPTNAIADEGNFPKITEINLGYSRDGFHWHRPDRRPFIEATRNEGDWDRAYLHGTTGVMLVMGDKLWFPYTGFSGISPDGKRGMYTGASIGMATLRRDGFASMEADAKKGFLTTQPVVFDGENLFVNVDSPDGELRVEVLDRTNNIIEPFSAENCKPIQVDKTLHAVQWENRANLAGLKGKPVKFKFYLTDGKLYSFWVSPDKSGASHGYVGAGGPGFEGSIDKQGINAY